MKFNSDGQKFSNKKSTENKKNLFPIDMKIDMINDKSEIIIHQKADATYVKSSKKLKNVAKSKATCIFKFLS